MEKTKYLEEEIKSLELCAELNYKTNFCKTSCDNYEVCKAYNEKAHEAENAEKNSSYDTMFTGMYDDVFGFDDYENENLNRKHQHAARRKKKAKFKNIFRSRVKPKEFFKKSKREQRDTPGRSAYSYTNLKNNHQEKMFEKKMKLAKKGSEHKKELISAKNQYEGYEVEKEQEPIYVEPVVEENLIEDELEMYVSNEFSDMLASLQYFVKNPSIKSFVKDNYVEMYNALIDAIIEI